MKKNSFLIVILLLILCVGIAYVFRDKETPNKPSYRDNPIVDTSNIKDFDIKMIQQTNNLYSGNYMISPLSMAYAFTLLKEGAKSTTLKDINQVLGDYELPTGVFVKDKVSIANLIFIRNTYKDDISTDYINTLQKNYDSDVMFDEFKSPKKVNDWISKKTFNMINNAVNKIDADFVLGLANAIAIDVEWKVPFECTSTREEDFTKLDTTTMKVAMMHGEDDVEYMESDYAKGIVKDYAIYDKTTGKKVYEENENTISLEYIAILPNTTIDEYMSVFDRNELNKLYASRKNSDKVKISYSLPKYKYEFEYDKLVPALKDLGMNIPFTGEANFEKMLVKGSEVQLVVDDVIHKTFIEVGETGTKAAAVTVVMMRNESIMLDEREQINIEFNRPFIYLIRQKGSNNIWFFGTVYEPTKYDEVKKCEVK